MKNLIVKVTSIYTVSVEDNVDRKELKKELLADTQVSQQMTPLFKSNDRRYTFDRIKKIKVKKDKSEKKYKKDKHKHH